MRASASFKLVFSALLAATFFAAACECHNRPVTADAVGKLAADGVLPGCRLAKQPAAFTNTAQAALARVRARRSLPFTTVAVNPTKPDPSALEIYVVRDARVDELDPEGCLLPDRAGSGKGAFDPHTVRGTCIAENSRVYCSAGAIDAVLEVTGGVEHPVSPFVFFLLAHEFAHIALGHPGAHTGASFSLDLSGKTEIKLSNLATACQVDQDQLEREQAADRESLDLLSLAFRERPFSADLPDPTLAQIRNAELTYDGIRKLDEWMASYYGSTSPLLSPTVYQVCPLLLERVGKVDLPALGGDHPHSWRRRGNLMAAIATSVSALELPEDSARELSLAVSILETNATTDSIRGFAFEAAVNRFCHDVDRVLSGALDCAHWIAEPGLPTFSDDELKAAGMPPASRPEKLPLPDLPLRAHSEVSGTPIAHLVTIDVHRKAATAARAVRVAEKTRAQIAAVLDAADRKLAAQGGYFVYQSKSPVESDYNPFIGGFAITSKVHVLARVPQGFSMTDLSEAKPLVIEGDLRGNSQPWTDAQYAAVMHFLSDPHDTHNDGKRVLTKKLPLDFYFDLKKARGGEPNQIAATFSALICYTADRLHARYKTTYTLDDVDDDLDPFYLIVRDPDISDNWYFPTPWTSVLPSGCSPIKVPDRSLAGNLSVLFDYANQSEQVPEADFKRMFGLPP